MRNANISFKWLSIFLVFHFVALTVALKIGMPILMMAGYILMNMSAYSTGLFVAGVGLLASIVYSLCLIVANHTIKKFHNAETKLEIIVSLIIYIFGFGWIIRFFDYGDYYYSSIPVTIIGVYILSSIIFLIYAALLPYFKNVNERNVFYKQPPINKYAPPNNGYNQPPNYNNNGYNQPPNYNNGYNVPPNYNNNYNPPPNNNHNFPN